MQNKPTCFVCATAEQEQWLHGRLPYNLDNGTHHNNYNSITYIFHIRLQQMCELVVENKCEH